MELLFLALAAFIGLPLGLLTLVNAIVGFLETDDALLKAELEQRMDESTKL